MALFLGLILSLLALNFLRDMLNRTIYRYLLRIFKNIRLTTYLFALVFLPGVALHEISHWIMAKILFVKTHQFSLIPEWIEDGTIRFGYVEMSKTDRLRSALIALAPLLTGVGVILWLSFRHLHLDLVLQGMIELEWETVKAGLKIFMLTPDLFLWIYLLFTISNTMLPSPSDRKAWVPVGAIFAVIYMVVVVISMGSPTSSLLVKSANSIAQVLIRAFGIAAILNLFFFVPLILLEKIFNNRRNILSSIWR